MIWGALIGLATTVVYFAVIGVLKYVLENVRNDQGADK